MNDPLVYLTIVTLFVLSMANKYGEASRQTVCEISLHFYSTGQNFALSSAKIFGF